jgi:hypothetical protein
MNKGWKSLQIPKTLFNQIKGIYPWFGYRSVSEYVRHKLVDAVQADLYRVDELKKGDLQE